MTTPTFDYRKRVVSLSNLQAMCDRVSGTVHRFVIDGMTAHRVRVSYSNPDEYGNTCPTIAHLPTYPGPFESCSVVLDPVRFTGGRREDESWQSFDALWDCPQLFRTTENDWRTELEILQTHFPGHEIRSEWKDGGSRQVFFYQGAEFKQRSDAQDVALTALRSLKQDSSHANH